MDRYYRLASAHYYTGDFEAALKDFKKCLQLNPSSKLACLQVFNFRGIRRKVEEVTKLVKKQRFDAAIHVEVSSYAEQIDFKDLRNHFSHRTPKVFPPLSKGRRLITRTTAAASTTTRSRIVSYWICCSGTKRERTYTSNSCMLS